jgi:Icc protein
MITLAHLSDLHLDGSERSADRAARAMAYLNDLPQPLDAVLVTGDIADHGRTDEYEEAHKVLSSPHPVFTCPGNHDVRSAYRRVLLGQDGSEAPINQVHRAAGATFALCDSTIPGQDDGLLSEETIAWLETVLGEARGEGPVFICFHHPPVTLGMPFIDSIRQRGEQRLADLVVRYPHVVALLCGHAHTAAATTFAGRPLLVAPGIVSTAKLPWERGDFVDLRLPPAVAFHILDDDLRLTTHYRVIV